MSDGFMLIPALIGLFAVSEVFTAIENRQFKVVRLDGVGAMVPLLTLGIPGSATTAVLIGAMMIHKLTPGAPPPARRRRVAPRLHPRATPTGAPGSPAAWPASEFCSSRRKATQSGGAANGDS